MARKKKQKDGWTDAERQTAGELRRAFDEWSSGRGFPKVDNPSIFFECFLAGAIAGVDNAVQQGIRMREMAKEQPQ